MNAHLLIAKCARAASALALFSLFFMVGCSSLPAPPVRPALYDFGPGLLSAAAPEQRAPLAPLALAEVESGGMPEGSTAVHYRLAYADGQQLRPYQLARWSQPPAQLLQQSLRTQLGQRRAVISADDATVIAREGGQSPVVLRIDLEEFSQIFTSASESMGLVRLRATLVESTDQGDLLLGQRLFIAQKPASSADAAGGTRALAQAAAQVAQDVAQWLEEVGR